MNILNAIELFCVGAVIGYAWHPCWKAITKIYNTAYEKTYGKKPPYEL